MFVVVLDLSDVLRLCDVRLSGFSFHFAIVFFSCIIAGPLVQSVSRVALYFLGWRLMMG